jgi:hypothetical protein
MVPSFVSVASTLKGLIEDKINLGETNINLTPYITKATLDVIGLVGKREMFFNIDLTRYTIIKFTHTYIFRI